MSCSAAAAGSYTSKKWKYTVKVLEQGKHGLVPTMNMGAWLDKYCPNIVKGRSKLHPSTVPQCFHLVPAIPTCQSS